jgi:hypothetical protein
MMKTMIASAAVLFALSTASFATAPAQESAAGYGSKSTTIDMEAKRRKPRVPGGSGCDSARDKLEHPECRRVGEVTTSPADIKSSVDMMEAKRSKPRVPLGSGCDDPADVLEHPECRS